MTKVFDGKVWYIITETDGKDNYWSYGFAISRNQNLKGVSVFNNPNVVHINACRTKAECKELVDIWNNQYKANNRSIW